MLLELQGWITATHCTWVDLEDSPETTGCPKCGSLTVVKDKPPGTHVAHFEKSALAASLFLSSIESAFIMTFMLFMTWDPCI